MKGSILQPDSIQPQKTSRVMCHILDIHRLVEAKSLDNRFDLRFRGVGALHLPLLDVNVDVAAFGKTDDEKAYYGDEKQGDKHIKETTNDKRSHRTPSFESLVAGFSPL